MASCFRSDWTLRDYPLRVRHQAAEPSDFDPPSGYVLIPWTVQIINWWQMSGDGDTREEAYADLERKFQEFRAANTRLPRPGTGPPLELPDTTEVERLESIAVDFLDRVLGFEEDDNVWISDESNLHDFELVQPIDVSLARIRKVYEVDASDVEGYKLVDIFARIADKQGL